MLTFWEHIEELRKTLLKIGITLLFGILVSFIFYKPLVQFFLSPLKHQSQSGIEKVSLERQRLTAKREMCYTLPDGATLLSPGPHVENNIVWLSSGTSIEIEVPKRPFLLLSPLEGFLSTLKISFWSGLLLTSPFWLFFLAQFLLPALRPSERKILVPFLLLSYLLLIGGLSVAYFWTLPTMSHFFASFNAGIGENAWSFQKSLDLTLGLLLAHALCFELIALLFLLTHLHLITPEQLRTSRKGVIVGSLLLAALLTPPDVLSQLLLAAPLILLYEGAIFYGILRQRNFKKSLSKYC